MSERADGVHDHVRTELVRFVRALRRGGASVPANAGTTAAEAIAEIGLGDRARARTALRASLHTDSDDFEAFDHLFEAFWRRLTTDLENERLGSSIDGGLEEGLASLGDPAVSEDAAEAPDDRQAVDRITDRSLAESFASAVSEADDGDSDGSGATAAAYSPAGSATTVDGRLPIGASGLVTPFRDWPPTYWPTTAPASRRGI
ncbi:hypothetical protein [Natrinema salifodinae]|uniref:Uncharacterized protein n=1 Tax=Natrinema salifodinae TaxID=1202768 RepID=A0A1I0QSN5_9EURY|nr:hypothetical protein [Natrinema salifodinae]SEW30426.1 hypothetical protein SAMN05216285_3851 [Natrinema salifodinae]